MASTDRLCHLVVSGDDPGLHFAAGEDTTRGTKVSRDVPCTSAAVDVATTGAARGEGRGVLDAAEGSVGAAAQWGQGRQVDGE